MFCIIFKLIWSKNTMTTNSVDSNCTNGQHSFVFWTFLCELADLNTKKMDIGDVEVLDKEEIKRPRTLKCSSPLMRRKRSPLMMRRSQIMTRSTSMRRNQKMGRSQLREADWGGEKRWGSNCRGWEGDIQRSSLGVWGMKDRMGSHKRGKFQACRGKFKSHCLKIPLCRDYVCHIVLDAINLHPSLPPTWYLHKIMYISLFVIVKPFCNNVAE